MLMGDGVGNGLGAHNRLQTFYTADGTESDGLIKIVLMYLHNHLFNLFNLFIYHFTAN